MTTRSSILAWRIPWTEEPGGLQSMGSKGPLKQNHSQSEPCDDVDFPWASVSIVSITSSNEFIPHTKFE